jgi:hypothetical protein
MVTWHHAASPIAGTLPCACTDSRQQQKRAALTSMQIGSFVRQVSLAFSANFVTALIFRASSMRYHLVLHAVGCFDTLFGTAN